MTTLDVSTPQQVPQEPAVERKQWTALVVLLFAVFMDMLDGNLVSVAIPSIRADLDASYAAVQWVSAGYVLAFALLLVTGGRLGDIYGRKRVFMLGVAGFTAASALCGFATAPEMLVGARLFQGAMAGLMVPQVLSIIHVTFPASKRPAVFAIYGVVGGIAATVAPLVGGVLVDLDLFGLGWRPIFLINVPIGLVGAYLGLRSITESKAAKALRLDLPGVALASLALLLLLYPLTQGRELGWPAWGNVLMALSAVVLAVFVVYERRREQRGLSPLVPLALFKARSFSAGQVLQLTLFLFTGAFFLAWYLFMQLGLGWSALHAGLTGLSFCVGAFITSALSVTLLAPKFGRVVLQIGALVLAAGLGAFLWVVTANGAGTSSWLMVGPLLLVGLGFGLIAPPIALFALSDVPHEDAGAASGLINTMAQLGLALGIALVSLVFFNPLGSHASSSAQDIAPKVRQELSAAGVPADQLDGIVTSFRSCATEQVSGKDAKGLPASCVPAPAVRDNPAAMKALAGLGRETTANAFAGALRPTLFTTIGLMLATLLVTFGLPKRAPEAQPDQADQPDQAGV
ncbi:MFS transporter [Streptomyces sp. NPDC046821]|uniref:MFS transporter n=1 Tax=Streptomyces sp. NPDC046821 TaxID=3154702 RepID=UPI0033CAC87F